MTKNSLQKRLKAIEDRQLRINYLKQHPEAQELLDVLREYNVAMKDQEDRVRESLKAKGVSEADLETRVAEELNRINAAGISEVLTILNDEGFWEHYDAERRRMSSVQKNWKEK